MSYLIVVDANSIPTKKIILNPPNILEPEDFHIDIDSNTLFCWTDGSKNKEEVGLGVFFKKGSIWNIYKKLHESIDINEAELMAIEQALAIAPGQIRKSKN